MQPAERIKIVRGDITALDVDAVVNAANETLLGGGGVDGAIHRAAGRRLVAACREIPEIRPGVRCPTGEARITDGFDLPARYIIHTVGPVWHGGTSGEPERLASCYRAALRLVTEHRLETIAFPAISCGVYGYPAGLAACVAVREVLRHLSGNERPTVVSLAAFSERIHDALTEALEAAMFPRGRPG